VPGPDSPDWSGAPVTTAQPATFTLITATEAGASATVIAAVAGRSIVVTAVSLVAGPAGPGALRGQVFGRVGWNVLDPGEVIAYASISPGLPSYNAQLAPQAAEVPAGEDVIAELISEPGVGSQYCQLLAVYYLV
jgi:hypothetical protein